MEDNQKPKSLYDVLSETQDFFRKLKMELETGYPYVTWRQNIEDRERKDKEKKAGNTFLGKVGRYIGITAIATLPVIMAASQYCNPSKEPQLRLSADPNAMVWSYPREYQSRNFKDVRPFGSLDEVVLRTQDGKVVTLNPRDEEFQEQERVYQDKIVPYLNE